MPRCRSASVQDEKKDKALELVWTQGTLSVGESSGSQGQQRNWSCPGSLPGQGHPAGYTDFYAMCALCH